MQSASLVYHLVDIPTGLSVGQFTDKTKAQAEMQNRDHTHGGFRHRIEEHSKGEK